MKYYLKEIKEEEFSDFLLNPFERSVYLGDILIQKYPRNPYVDDFFSSNFNLTEIKRIGHILYKKNEIILEKTYIFKSNIIDEPPFVTDLELQNELEKKIRLKVEEVKKSSLEEIKSSEKYKELYDDYKETHFNSIVFSILGTTGINLTIKSKTNDAIYHYVSKIKSDDFVEARAGELDLVSPIITRLIGSDNFIESEIVINELRKEAEEYVAAGKFSKRELTLIDYLEKTKASKALSLVVTSTKGLMMICKNKVNYEGIVISKDGKMLKMDVEDIEIVEHDGKIIYTKKMI